MNKYIEPEIPKPEGAQHFFRGAWHKIGLHNRVYIHNGIKWLSSSKSKADYHREVRLQAKEYIACRIY